MRVRPVAPDDGPSLHAMCEQSSDRSIYLRFFSANRQIADGYLTSLAGVDGDDRAAVVAEVAGRIVAVAGWERMSQRAAEVALLVEDDQQGRGLGTLLLEELADQACHVGITSLVADTLVENRRMLNVFARSGLHGRSEFEEGVVRWRLSTDLDDAALLPVDDREATAEGVSLQPLLAPGSVVVIGASHHPGGVGHEVLRSILAAGFTGSVQVVNPGALEVAGLPSYAHVSELPVRPDLAVIAVPPDAVVHALDSCGQAGVRAAVVLTDGLGPAGASDAERRAELLSTARRHGIRLVGPDSLGVLSTDPGVRLAAWFGGPAPEAGRLALATQSGTVGIAIAEHAGRHGLGLAELVSLGDKVDVSGNDLLLRWWHDRRVGLVALYLESLGNPRKFARLARRVGASKPVLVVKGGRVQGGRNEASGTSATTAEDALEALFAQAGVLRMDTVEELVDVARLLDSQPLPAGGRLAIVGNGGGIAVLAADAAHSAGLEVPEFSAALRTALGPDRDNPVDLGPASSPEALARTLEAVAGSGEVDVLLVTLAVTAADDAEALLKVVSAADVGDLTVVVTLLGAPDGPAMVPMARGDRAPVFHFPEPAVRAVGRAVRHGRWRRTGPGTAPQLDGVRRDDARVLVGKALAAAAGDERWAEGGLTRDLLACYGITVTAAVTTGPTRHDAPLAVLVVGVTREDTFGPVATVGLGGVLPDLLGDRAFRLLPLTDRDATEMLLGLRAAPLLQGYRGTPVADRAAVEDLLLRVSLLADDVPELCELDLSPVHVSATGVVVVDARLRLEPAVPVLNPRRRSLR